MWMLWTVLFFSVSATAEFKVVDIGLYSSALSEGEQNAPTTPQTEAYSFCTDVRQKIVKEKIMTQIYQSHCNDVTLEDLKTIYELKFEGVTLTHIESGDFLKLDNLKYLELSNNTLESISADAFKDLEKLTHLVIFHNSIKQFSSGVFQMLKRLEHLNLSHNLLEDGSTEWLEGLVNLKHLDLSHNALTSLSSPFFESVVALRVLNLSHNQLESILDVLHPLSSLLALDISHNGLRALDVNGLSSLVRLNLSQNKLSALDWSVLTKLVECDISDNQWTHLPWADIHNINDMNIFNYAGNPLNNLVIYPKRNTYSTGVDEKWKKCLGVMECRDYYAWIIVNEQQYNFMDCEGTDGSSEECYKLSQEWLRTLNSGHPLYLELDVDDRTIITKIQPHSPPQ